MNLKYLPNKVLMKAAIAAFDLRELPTIDALELILMHTNEGSLNLYCDNEIKAIEVNEDIGEIFDDNDDFIDFICVPDEKIKTLTGPKIMQNAHAYSSGSKLLISVYRFSQNSIGYFIPNEQASETVSESFSYNDFYLDGNELSDYLENRPKKKISTKKNKSTVPKSPNTLSRRETAFKHWLATKADLIITDDSQYQKCYEKIDEPTRAEVWKMLKKLDGKLFASGEDDFAKQGVIKFKLGTGKKR